MTSIKRLVLIQLSVVAVAVLIAACGSTTLSTATPSNEPIIELVTNPNPPTQGPVEIIVNVKDASGQPIANADVFVSGNHTEMTGMSMNGKATSLGNGRYAIKANFGMAGNWKLQVQVKKPPLNTVKEFALKFQ